MALHLLECNDDVLCLILAYLSRADLRAVCLVHPYLRRLAEPLLYATIKFPKFYSGAPNPITALIRSLLHRPDLAAHVRTICCKGGHWGSYLYKSKHLPTLTISESDLRQAISFVESIRLPYQDDWLEGLRQGSLDAYLTIIIAQLPRLQQLHLSEVCVMETRLLGSLLQSIISCPGGMVPGVRTSLNKVHTVSVLGDHITPNTQNLLPFFYLPSIRELALNIDYPAGPTLVWPVAHPPLAEKLVSLKLTSMRESHLGQLLCRLPRLRSLYWEWEFDPSRAEDPSNSVIIDLDLVMSALTHVGGTLTELVITASTVWPNGFSSLPPLRVQGSARAFTGMEHLKTLVVPLAFFTGFTAPPRERLAACLAPNLEDLTLTDDLYLDIDPDCVWDDEAQFTQEIASWLEDVRVSTPNLRKLGLVLQAEDNEIRLETLAVRDRIRELTRAGDIELEEGRVNNF